MLQEYCYTPFFSFLDHKKKGNSDHLDRIDILELFISTFGINKIEVIIGDREFIGDNWLQYLDKLNIPYVMRIKENNQYLTNNKSEFIKANNLFRNLKANQEVTIYKRKLGKKSKYFYNLTAYRDQKHLS